VGVDYINTIPWFCSKVCTVVIGSYIVYENTDTNHITATWAKFLRVVLADALHLPSPHE
jgi:hypothetical protein